MKRIHDAISAIDTALSDSARTMQRDLRRSALEHGWEPEVVSSMAVHYKEGSFKVHVPASHADKAFVHEFGNENNQPTAVIRKYDNTKKANQVFVRNMTRHMKGSK